MNNQIKNSVKNFHLFSIYKKKQFYRFILNVKQKMGLRANKYLIKLAIQKQ